MANLHGQTIPAILTAAFLPIGLVTGMPAPCQGQPQPRPIDAPQCRSVLKTRQGQLSGHYLSSDDKVLITCSFDESAMIWDVATGARRHFIKKQSEGEPLRIWDVMSATQKRLVVEQPGAAAEIGYSPVLDSSHVAISIAGTGVSVVS